MCVCVRTVGCMNVCAFVNVPVEWAYACEKSRWSSDESKATIENWANGQMTVSLMLTAAAVCANSFLSRCGPCTVLLGKEVFAWYRARQRLQLHFQCPVYIQ